MALILVMIAFAIPVSAATYTYDNLGRLTSATTNSGASCTYTYDVGENLLSGTGQSSLAVLSTNPQDQASNVPVGQSVYLQFSMNIEQYTNFSDISLMMGATPVSINAFMSNDMLTIDPVDNLVVNTRYTVTVPAEAVKAVSGSQSNAKIIMHFTTASSSLSMVSSDPVNNTTDVPVGQSITVTFNQDTQAGDNYASISLTGGGQSTAFTCSMAGSILTIDPSSDLTVDTTYTLLIPAGALKNLNSTAMNGETNIQFTTESV
jgi:hypothetical protein